MKPIFFLLLLVIATPAFGQKETRPTKLQTKGIPNPFLQPVELDGMYGGGGYGDEEMLEDMGMDMDMGMGMGGMGGGMSAGESEEGRFKVRLQRAIQMLKSSKSQSQKVVLQGYIKEAFTKRYDRMMSDRTKDIQRLKASITKLESDLKRRVAAKDRVVQLQLQSVQLAAEGLLELNDLQGVGNSHEGMSGGMGEMEGDSMGGGGAF